MVTTIYIRASRKEVRETVAKLPSIMAGKVGDPDGLIRGLQTRIGVAALSSIQKAYNVKSKGGRDETGIQWQELSPVTLALRRVDLSGKAFNRLKERVGKLTAERLARFQALHLGQLRMLTGDSYLAKGQRRRALRILYRSKKTMTEKRFKDLEKLLQGKVKKEKVEQYAYAQAAALILRDTGVLFNSFSPGIDDRPARTEGQKFEVSPGFVVVGTNVPYAVYHQSDKPRKMKRDGSGPILPRREITPPPENIPDAWWSDWNQALMNGLATAAFWEAFLKA